MHVNQLHKLHIIHMVLVAGKNVKEKEEEFLAGKKS
jgi:hypothetical protein